MKIQDILTKSLEFFGDKLQLKNDEDAPGNSKYYGTNETGAKGFHVLPEGGGASFPDMTGSAGKLFKVNDLENDVDYAKLENAELDLNLNLFRSPELMAMFEKLSLPMYKTNLADIFLARNRYTAEMLYSSPESLMFSSGAIIGDSVEYNEYDIELFPGVSETYKTIKITSNTINGSAVIAIPSNGSMTFNKQLALTLETTGVSADNMFAVFDPDTSSPPIYIKDSDITIDKTNIMNESFNVPLTEEPTDNVYIGIHNATGDPVTLEIFQIILQDMYFAKNKPVPLQNNYIANLDDVFISEKEFLEASFKNAIYVNPASLLLNNYRPLGYSGVFLEEKEIILNPTTTPIKFKTRALQLRSSSAGTRALNLDVNPTNIETIRILYTAEGVDPSNKPYFELDNNSTMQFLTYIDADTDAGIFEEYTVDPGGGYELKLSIPATSSNTKVSIVSASVTDTSFQYDNHALAIRLEDKFSNFTSDDVEGALNELADRITVLETP